MTTGNKAPLRLIDDAENLLGCQGADDWLADKPSQPPLRDPVILREQVILQLRCIIDPDLHQDIVSLGFLKELNINYENSSVSFTLELTTPACPVKDQFVHEAERLLKELEWVETVNVSITSRPPRPSTKAQSKYLEQVGHIIAVASCKGGVGKSTIACNLAYMLKNQGASVGLVDLDVYGPSLPFLVPLEDASIIALSKKEKHYLKEQTVYYEGQEKRHPDTADEQEDDSEGFDGFVPLIHQGVKLMSYGYFKASKKYAAIRGPIASGLVSQMVGNTIWGQLDYLIIDLPPGTGDIHLTVAQTFSLTGAIMITTPQQLSLADVEKGIAMFNELKIPTLAIVENMSVFNCPACNTSTEVFQSQKRINGMKRLIDQFGICIEQKLPLHPALAEMKFLKNGHHIFPFVLAFNQEHAVWDGLFTLSQSVIREVSTLKFSIDRLVPKLVLLDSDNLELVIPDKPAEKILLATTRHIRIHCSCAQCVDEVTGESKINLRKVSANVTATHIQLSGNYAFKIAWSDKHQSLYSFNALEKLFTKAAGSLSTSGCYDSAGDDW